MPSERSRRKRTKNPISRFLPWYIGVVFALVGLGVLADQDWVLSQSVISLILLVGGLLGLIWTFFALQMGRIATVSSSTGTTYTYERRKEPIMFFTIVVVYVAVCLFCAVVGIWMLLAQP